MTTSIEVSALTMYNVEKYLELNQANVDEGKPLETEPFAVIPARKIKNVQKERLRLAEKYDLKKKTKTSPFTADDETVFAKICEYYPCAKEFSSLKKIINAMKYGNAPCITYNLSDLEKK